MLTEDGCFNNRVCMPTENSVQKSELLYAPYIAGYAVRAKVPHWQEKVPCKAVVDSIDNRDARELFEKINFCKALSFEDCLYYLARVTHPREEETHFRSIVINWMLSSPIQDETLVDTTIVKRQLQNGVMVRGRRSILRNFMLSIQMRHRKGISSVAMSLLCRQVLSLMIQIRLSRSATC